MFKCKIGLPFIIIVLALSLLSSTYDTVPTPGPTPILQECRIDISEDGKTYTYTKLLSPGQTASWPSTTPSSFIMSTSGPCHFTVFNKENFQGSYVTLGSKLTTRIRAGLDGVTNKDFGGGDTWRIRSIKMTRVDATCKLYIGGGDVRMEYYSGDLPFIPAMDRISWFLGGDCRATIWPYPDFGREDSANRFKSLHPGYPKEVYDPGFRVRSMKIWDEKEICSSIACDQGRCLPQITLAQSIYNVQTSEEDQDQDGLIDALENGLAFAFRPIYVNHSTEDATRVKVYISPTGEKVIEPVTVFQVHPVKNGEVIIRFMKLWLEDKYDSFWCGGHHGDSQGNQIYLKTTTDPSGYGKFWYVYKTRGGNEGELNWEMGDESIRGVTFERWTGEMGTTNHLVIYLTKGKHHEYADAGWAGQPDKNFWCNDTTALIDSKGNLHVPPLPKRIAIIQSPLGKGDRYQVNNVGNRQHHAGFLDDLTSLGFPGQIFWSGKKFYDADSACRGFE